MNKGRALVHATFDGELYDGSIVNMGVKNPDGSICYIIGIRKDIRERVGKKPGDTISVTITERIPEKDTGPTTIDEYIAGQSPEVQPLLQKIRETIHATAPDAIEKMSWQMPTFWQGENLIHFAANKKHIGIYPGGKAVGVFTDRLTGYKASKGAIQLPLDKPIDYQLIADIVRWRLESIA